MKFPNSEKKFLIKLIFNGLLIVTGIFFWNFHKKIIEGITKKIFVLTPNSKVSQEWRYPNINVNIEMYFFNWTNPYDFNNKSIKVKPKFKEIGPYVFNQKFERINVTFNKNYTVTYRNKKYFYYNKEKSKGNMDDNITTLNIVPTIAVHKSKNWNYFLRKALSFSLNNISFNITHKVKEYLFDGFEDQFLNSAKYLPFLNDVPDMDKFAWFYNRNGSSNFEGIFNIGTGIGNTTLGTLYQLNYENKGPYPGNCSKLQASTGELFEPNSINKKKIEFFSIELCRIVALDFNKTLIWNGIRAYKFIADISFFDNGTHITENKCLCKKNCLKYGVVDYSKCKFGIPAYISLPHFYKADEYFRRNIEGMLPNHNKHEMYMIINPETGIVLDVSMSTQLNIYIKPSSDITKFQNVPELLFPIFWFNVKSTIPEHIQNYIKIYFWIPKIIEIVSITLITIGIILIIYNFHKKLHIDERNNDNNYENKEEEMQPLK